jgi:hypothetical protein
MSKQDFMEKFRHEWAGMVLDAATSGCRGAELAFAMRHTMQKIDRHLALMYDALVRSEAQPTPTVKVGK